MSANRLEDDDRMALASISDLPPGRKAQSYSQQLRTSTGNHHLRTHQLRNRSLDENRILSQHSATKDGIYFGGTPDDEEFYRYSTTTSGGIADAGDESQDLPQRPLPEFVGSGGGVGIFKVPNRAPVNPNRPPCVELRAHPLRETQVGRFLRTIASTEKQLWAGQESGVRVWSYFDAFIPGIGVGGRATRGDEDAAPFYESPRTSPAICLAVDQGGKLVCSGHKDGKIRSWKMDLELSDDSTLKECLSWQAHRGPVLSLEISSYGDLWSGSENGNIRVWPWEAVEKSLSLSPEEKHMASLLVETSVIDLKSQVSNNGVDIPHSDVKCLLGDSVLLNVWAVGSQIFSIWDARTRELIKVFNIEGQTETRVEMPIAQDQSVEDEVNTKLVSKPKKEKSPGFLQRSRNAIMGAADAVHRAAGKGGSSEDGKRTEAIVLAANGMIWTGCSNGSLIQWDGNGNCLQDLTHHPCGILCLCSYGSRIWVGYASGMVQLLDLEGKLIAGWVAHNGPVIKLVVGSGNVYSLATHGGIRGWNISSPAPIDSILRSELAEREIMLTKVENVKILVGTWNVGQGRASQDAVMSWIGSSVSDVGVVVVGLQEVEMGAGFLAMSAAKETVGIEGSATGQWWQDHIGKILDEEFTFERVGSRQLAGLMIAIWVRKTLRSHVGDLDVSAVACGFGHAIGNKGGVGLRLRVVDRIMCFVNCHLAAHLEAVNRRNSDFDHIYRTMSFTRSYNNLNIAKGMLRYLYLTCSIVFSTYLFWLLLYSCGLPWLLCIAAGVSSAAQMLRCQDSVTVKPDEGKPDLAEADMVVFFGDFNYRLFGISYDEARDFISQRSFDWLREKDQLRAEMKAGKAFQGMREAIIRFPPTYKFDPGRPGLGGYDSSEKKRIPAWCDRVLYRDSRATPLDQCSLTCPVVASVLEYIGCMDVTESDHKPVRCKFDLDIAHVDRSLRRQEFGKILKFNDAIRSSLEALRFVPETTVNTNIIMLEDHKTFNLKITNRSGKDMVFFQIVCLGQSIMAEVELPSYHRLRGFPRWLEVTPAGGAINPEQVAEISMHYEEFQNSEESADATIQSSWSSKGIRVKEVILLVNVRGSCSTEARTHQIHVRHCFTGSAEASPKEEASIKRGGSSHQEAVSIKPGAGSNQDTDSKESASINRVGSSYQEDEAKESCSKKQGGKSNQEANSKEKASTKQGK